MPLGLGLAASHAPNVWRPVEKWPAIYEFLTHKAEPPGCEPLEELHRQYARIQQSLKTIRDELVAYHPDAVIIVGDDQNEVFSKAFSPTIAIFTGDRVDGSANTGVLREPQDENHVTLRCHPGLARRILEGLVERGFDPAEMEELVPMGRPATGLGHAFAHLGKGLGLDDLDIPVIIVFLNAYRRPMPSARRCYDLGRALRATLADHPERVALIGSGGLMHYPRGMPDGWIDENLDRWVLERLARGEGEALTNLFTFDSTVLRGGTGEIRNWIVVAGAFEGLGASIIDYIPVKHGCTGLGFASWKPNGQAN